MTGRDTLLRVHGRAAARPCQTMTATQQSSPQRLLTECNGVGGLLAEMQLSSIFLVADAVGYEASGAGDILEPMLRERLAGKLAVTEPNPQWPNVLECARAIGDSGADAVLAVGGGTAMDIAKLAGWLSVQNNPETILETFPETPALAPPLIAVPTTAGSGAEATHFAVVYREGQKHSVAHETLRPAVAVVDAALTANLPPALTAHSGLDALCQAIESIWSIRATEDSLSPATAALALAWQHLEAAVNDSTPADRSAMAWASHLAGQAINLTQTTAPHALSYTLTSKFGIPHGAAVALTLGPILAFNAQVTEANCADPRGPEAVLGRLQIICEALGAKDVDEAAALFRRKVEAVNCATTLAGAGVSSEATVETICERVNLQRLANNPRRMTEDDIRELLNRISG